MYPGIVAAARANRAFLARAVRFLVDQAIASGSYLAVSHGYRDPDADVPGVRDAEAVYRHTTSPTTLRTRAQIAGLFGGFDLVAPGLVPVTAWYRSTPEAATGVAVPVLAGVARKP